MTAIDVTNILKTLRSERAQALKEVSKLDKAILSLGQLSGLNSSSSSNGHVHKLSATARRKIAKAQRERWARFRKEQKTKK